MFDQSQESFVALKNTFAENTSPVYVWIGAGLSIGAGFPSWDELRKKMIYRCRSFLGRQEESKERSHKQKLLDVAETEGDLWKAFDRIYEAVGISEYERAIVAEFKDAPRCKLPENYKRLFRLNIKGAITTNIDKLATRAFLEVMSDNAALTTPKEFTGWDCKAYSYVLSSRDFFILHLHGFYENSESLIMRGEDIENLSKDKWYQDFVRALFSSSVIVFVGVNPMDQSIRQHLDAVRDAGVCCAPMYWITERNDQVAADFANQYGIQQIFYASVANHRDFGVVLDLLQKSESQDEILYRPGISNLPRIAQSVRNLDAVDLKTKSGEEIRSLLNKKACEILRNNNAEGYKEYERFLRKYSRAIHNSWYLEPGESLLGLTIEKEVDDGAFGRVFRAQDEKGDTVAVKLLKSDLMRKPDCIQSFRRGVRAMEILAAKNVPGVVRYKFASEIPAFVAMEYIEGENLHTVVKKRLLDSWRDKMKVLSETAKIVQSAHALPERVLHRDIRPQNIMLKGYDYSSSDWSVCVLDFDLAFHKGANEVSMQMASALNGYLAPEQIDRSGRFGTTRSSRVDSYGFAMLCYYVITGKAPRPDQCFQEGWTERIFTDVCARKCREWIALPYEMARIIERCTKSDQNARMDMYKVNGYLQMLRQALSSADAVNVPELLVDELACLIANETIGKNKVEIDHAGHRMIHCIDGQTFQLYNDNECIRVETSWHNAGTSDFSKVKKLVQDRAESLVSRLRKAGIKEVNYYMEGSGVVVELRFDFGSDIHPRMEKLADVFGSYKIYTRAL